MYMCLQCISSIKFYVSKVFSSQTLFNITIKYVKCTYMQLLSWKQNIKYYIIKILNSNCREKKEFSGTTQPTEVALSSRNQNQVLILQLLRMNTGFYRRRFEIQIAGGNQGLGASSLRLLKPFGVWEHPPLKIIFQIEVLGKAISCILRASHRH